MFQGIKKEFISPATLNNYTHFSCSLVIRNQMFESKYTVYKFKVIFSVSVNFLQKDTDLLLLVMKVLCSQASIGRSVFCEVKQSHWLVLFV